MKTYQSICLVLLASIRLTCVGEAQPLADTMLLKFAQGRTNAVRITEKPVKMYDRVALLCYFPLADMRVWAKTNALGQRLENPHEHKYAHVFVSTNGATAMRTNSAVFPVGSIIIKEKFSDLEGKKTELFTGMVKRENGYNSKCGDWEFFTLSADAVKVTSRGKLQSCIDCHVEYKESDYVTKKYVMYPR